MYTYPHAHSTHTHNMHVHTRTQHMLIFVYVLAWTHVCTHTQSGGNPDLEFMLRVNQIMIDFVNDGGKTE